LKRYLDDAEEVMDDGTGSLMQSETYLFDQLAPQDPLASTEELLKQLASCQCDQHHAFF